MDVFNKDIHISMDSIYTVTNAAEGRIASRASLRDYLTLMKPRVTSLVVFTGVVGMSLAPGHLSPLAAFFAILSLALGSGAAGAINMWIERDSDVWMERTRNRPIPAGRIPADDAFHFAVACGAFSILTMAMTVNLLAASLLLATILFYVFVYTLWLKPRTPVSIVIGGAAGAMPPMIGWAAVADNVSLLPILLFLITCVWTPAHFWPLALVRCDEYRRAGIPMLVVVVGKKITRRQIVLYTLVLLPVSLLPYVLGMAGLLYAIGATFLGIGFLFHSVRLWRRKNLRFAMPVFTYSLFYLTGIFALLVIDRMYN